MRILITNDDGVYSPGIAALAQVASRFGEVRIVAPDVEMSSASHSITASRPVTYKRTPAAGSELEAYRVNGTPGDCVMLGTTLWEKVDLVLSGINIGTNLGNAIWHSGTLAGAKQAALLGLRGIAFSAPATDREQPSFEMLKPWVATVLEALLEVPDMPLVNVNFPAKPPRGTRVDAPVDEALRRQGSSGQGPDGSHALLVHRGAGRSDRGRHRPLGDRAAATCR